MPNKYPFAIRLIGFPDQEGERLCAMLSGQSARGHHYFALHDDNLQDPDIFIANAADLRALVQLSSFKPNDLRPALLIGSSTVPLPHPSMERPVDAEDLLAELDDLIDTRADALVRLQASDVVTITERRRHQRLDVDLTDPTEYANLRRKPVNGGVLVVDKAATLSDYLAAVLRRQRLSVACVNDDQAALSYCREHPVSVVVINTSTPDIDPYELCQRIKRSNSVQQTSVIFLTGKPFIYDPVRARCAGSDGFLNKPLATHHLLAALRKFLPALQARREAA